MAFQSLAKIIFLFCRDYIHSEGHIHYYKCLVFHFDFESTCDKLTCDLKFGVPRVVLVEIQVF
jgi:hypothetical protein